MSEINNRSIRKHIPARSAVTKQKNYRKYKSDLRKDFSKRCGYCDDSDEFCGGERGYHIDHFAPKSLFPKISTEYENLVYSCPFCNGAKSDKWIGTDSSVSNNGQEGFIDPCDSEYDKHLCRGTDGSIEACSTLGRYIVKNLKLHLIRHALIWQIQELLCVRNKIESLMPLVKDRLGNQSYVELLEGYMHVTNLYEKYRERAIES